MKKIQLLANDTIAKSKHIFGENIIPLHRPSF